MSGRPAGAAPPFTPSAHFSQRQKKLNKTQRTQQTGKISAAQQPGDLAQGGCLRAVFVFGAFCIGGTSRNTISLCGLAPGCEKRRRFIVFLRLNGPTKSGVIGFGYISPHIRRAAENFIVLREAAFNFSPSSELPARKKKKKKNPSLRPPLCDVTKGASEGSPSFRPPCVPRSAAFCSSCRGAATRTRPRSCHWSAPRSSRPAGGRPDWGRCSAPSGEDGERQCGEINLTFSLSVSILKA